MGMTGLSFLNPSVVTLNAVKSLRVNSVKNLIESIGSQRFFG